MSEQQHLSTLSYFERQEYEQLKIHTQKEAKRLYEQGVFLGLFVVGFISALIMAGILKVDLSMIGVY